MSASSSGETEVDSITLCEHDTSRPLDLAEADLQAIDAEINQKRTRLDYEFTAGGKVRLKTSSHVGVVSLPSGKRIRVQPKAAGQNFLRLLLYAQNASPSIQESTVDAESGTLFIDAIGALFLEHVEAILRQGLAKEYRQHESREQYLRGRLDVQRQLSRGSVATTQFDVEYSDLTHDTLANQAVLYATSLLVQLVQSESLQRSLRRCEQQLRREVTMRPVQPREFDQIHLDRLTAHYGDVLRLAELVVRSTFVDNFRTGNSGTYGVLVNMNRVFEASVERAAREAVKDTGWSVEGQAQLRRLVTGGSPTINMYPDFVLRGPNDEVRLVGDAKWKTGRVSQSDVYQMTSYQLADDVPGLLVYPSQPQGVETSYVIDDRLSLHLRELPTDRSEPSFDRFTGQLEQALRTEFESLSHLDE